MDLEFHQEHEKMFLSYLNKRPEYFDLIEPEYFESECLDDFYLLVKDHYKAFKTFPTSQDLKIKLKGSDYDHIPSSYSDIISKSSNYSDEYAEEEIQKWIKYRSLKINVIKAAEYLQSSKFTGADPDYLLSKIREMFKSSPNFSNEEGLDFYSAEDHAIFYEDKIRSNYEFFNFVTGGGYDPKTLIVYVGPPNIGKSIYLANEASGFVRQGKNVLFISAEMSDKKCIKRLGSINLGIPLNSYDQKSRDVEYMSQKIKEFKYGGVVDPGELHIVKVPTSRCTSNDIEAIIKRKEEKLGIKFDCLVVDYINILADARNKSSDNSYNKIKNISEDLRAIADIHDLLVVTATQTRRDGFNSTDITMEHIAESAALSHTADVIWAIIQTTEMYANAYYKLKLIKTRDSEAKHTMCRINIDPLTLRLTEEPDSTENPLSDYADL